MTDRQKQAIEALNKVRACSNALTKEEYFLLLEFIVDKPMQVWSPTWTPPQWDAPMTTTDGVTNDKFRNVFKDFPEYKVLHPDDAADVHNQITQQEFESRLNALLKDFESVPKNELIDTLEFYLKITKDNE